VGERGERGKFSCCVCVCVYRTLLTYLLNLKLDVLGLCDFVLST